MDYNPIIFAGCSYTWGEGLELYQETPKWIEARKSNHHHHDILKITDESSIKFREENRFAGLVAKHYGIESYVTEENGGNLASSIRHIESTIDSGVHPKVIVLQHTNLNRNPYHYDYSCQCPICLQSEWTSIFDLMDWVNRFQDKLRNMSHETLDDIFTFKGKRGEYFRKLVNDAKINRQDNLESLFNKVINLFSDFAKINLEKVIINKFKKLEQNHHLFFLDSWHKDSSNILSEFDYIKDRTIPLIGSDGKEYKEWDKWQDTLDNFSITNVYPHTDNHHPSLEAHKIIADSIINFFDKKGIKFKKHYI